MSKKKIDRNDANYTGMHMLDLRSRKDLTKKAAHPIFLYSPKAAEDDPKLFKRLDQIVAIMIANHYKHHLGDTTIGMYTLGQSVKFRVVKHGEVFQLSLFKFLMNYTMLCVPILMGADLSNWQPMTPDHWSSDAWCQRMDQYIKMCRPLGNMRAIS